jgi:RNA polymerase-binding transcription factor DksA
MAKLRSELESLQEKIQEREVQVLELAGLVNSCVEKCHLSFAKMGKEVRDYEQSVRLLKEEKDSLSKECEHLKNISEGAYILCNNMVNCNVL